MTMAKISDGGKEIPTRQGPEAPAPKHDNALNKEYVRTCNRTSGERCGICGVSVSVSDAYSKSSRSWPLAQKYKVDIGSCGETQ